MNYKRGLLRLWVVASALWILYMLIILPFSWSGEYFNQALSTLGRSYDYQCSQDKECGRSREELARLELEESKLENIYTRRWQVLLIGALVPPVVVLITVKAIMTMMAWIISGFRTSPL